MRPIITFAFVLALLVLPITPANAQCGAGGCARGVSRGNGGPLVRSVARVRGVRILPRNRR